MAFCFIIYCLSQSFTFTLFLGFLNEFIEGLLLVICSGTYCIIDATDAGIPETHIESIVGDTISNTIGALLGVLLFTALGTPRKKIVTNSCTVNCYDSSAKSYAWRKLWLQLFLFFITFSVSDFPSTCHVPSPECPIRWGVYITLASQLLLLIWMYLSPAKIGISELEFIPVAEKRMFYTMIYTTLLFLFIAALYDSPLHRYGQSWLHAGLLIVFYIAIGISKQRGGNIIDLFTCGIYSYKLKNPRLSYDAQEYPQINKVT